MNFVGVWDVVSTFDIWFHAVSKGPKIFIWRMAFFALCGLCKS